MPEQRSQVPHRSRIGDVGPERAGNTVAALGHLGQGEVGEQALGTVSYEDRDSAAPQGEAADEAQPVAGSLGVERVRLASSRERHRSYPGN